MPKSDGVCADRKIVERVSALCIGARVACELRVPGDGVDLNVRQGAAGGIRHGAGDSAESLLGMRWEGRREDGGEEEWRRNKTTSANHGSASSKTVHEWLRGCSWAWPLRTSTESQIRLLERPIT